MTKDFDQNPRSAAVRCSASLRELTFSYADMPTPALSNLNFSVMPGDFIGIIGPTGAGKSTLCSALTGAIPHHFAGQLKGEILIEGQDSFNLSLTDISRQVGSVLQDIDAQMVTANVEDEILYGLENFSFEKNEIKARLDWALDTVGIRDLAAREIASLSGGQKQKVAIAAILALRPHTLVLDEPTAALDPASSQKVYETLAYLNQHEGITIVVVEQKVALLSQFCSKLAVMSKGTIVAEGSPAEVLSKRELLREVGVNRPRFTRLATGLKTAGLLTTEDIFVKEHEAYSSSKELLEADSPANLAELLSSDTRDFGEAYTEVKDLSHGDRVLLELDGVHFSYGKNMAGIHDISFKLHEGEMLAIVGQNGAGKTTLTKLLTGLLRPSAGSIHLLGEDLAQKRTSEIAAFVSTLFQNPDHQICKNKVLDEIVFSEELLGRDLKRAKEEALQLCERFSLDPEAAPFSLSRGQRQLVCLASVLITKPKLLILDEPTAGLDYLECKQVMTAVHELRGLGTAVCMVCHDMEVASDFSNRLIVMGEGQILFDGSKQQAFRDSEILKRASIAAPEIIALSERLAATESIGTPVKVQLKDISEVRDLISLIACVRGV